MSFGQNKSSQESQSTQGLGTLNPFLPILGEALGIGTTTNQGGFGFTGSTGSGKLFGSLSGGLSDLFGRVDAPAFDLGGAAEGLRGSLATLQEGASTGFADRINALNQNILFSDTIPQLQEQLGVAGLNIGDSDFGRALASAVTRSGQETAVSAIGNQLNSSLALGDLTSQLGGFEQMFRDTLRGRPGGQQAIQQLLGLAQGAGLAGTGSVGQSTSEGSGSGFNAALGG